MKRGTRTDDETGGKREGGCKRAVSLRRAPVGTGVTIPEGISEVRNDFLLRNDIFVTLSQYLTDVRGNWKWSRDQ